MKSIVRNALLALVCVLQALLFGVNAAAASGVSAPDPMPQTVVYGNCSWNHPGVNPFMGDVVAAVDRYRDIPPEVRARLKARMEKREYDDLVSIRRDSIDGRGGYDYGNTITDMHFGTHQLCRSVTRSSWTPDMQERGLVYCESGQCILVPTVCRNVSRITRGGVGPDAAAAPPLLASAPDLAGFPPIDWFGPAGAGIPAADAPIDGALVGVPPLDGMVGGYPFAGIGAGPLIGAGFAGAVIGGLLAGDNDNGNGGGSSAGPGFNGGGGGGGGSFIAPGAPVIVAGGGTGGQVATPVPEPEAWALLLMGLAAIGAVALRRQDWSRGSR
jgi:hypothetical protein